MKIMQPIATKAIEDDGFIYEVKYDGFRALLIWDKHDVQIRSRNNVQLTNKFPEIVAICEQMREEMRPHLPLTLDGELVILNNEFQAHFPAIQLRGRLQNNNKIDTAANDRPATFLAFDLIEHKGSNTTNLPLEKRKQTLKHVMDHILPIHNQLKLITVYSNQNEVQKVVSNYRSEGIIAKRNNSKYIDGKQHYNWFKIKNWRTFSAFLTKYNPNNGYFTVSVFRNHQVIDIGKCKHGLPDNERQIITDLFIKNSSDITEEYELPPAICAEIQTLDLYEQTLREPQFARLRPNYSPEECTYEQMQIDLAMMPDSVTLSNLDKPFWPEPSSTKGDLLVYMRLIYPYIKPFLQDRALTIIRSPDGVNEESFYQKSLPTYAPEFIAEGDSETIICNELDALIWLANQGTVEYHVPFQFIGEDNPVEIVFDLDPPDRSKFHLAVEAALLIKQLIDSLEIASFVKTSGNKGLQIHIPLPPASMTYDETAIFTEAIATTLVRKFPHLFTIERLKKNRNNKLYIDYVQHGKGKTIIAPYSPRKTKEATVATPLFWHELTEDLSPVSFTIQNVVERVQKLGCPFAHYEEIGHKQNMEHILQLIRT